MIELPTLERMNQALYVYDVEQGAWEQEKSGFEANAGHVLTHLSKDMLTKAMFDPGTARAATAPDHIQYALRLLRWSGQTPADFGHPVTADIGFLMEASLQLTMRNMSIRNSIAGAVVTAMGTLGENLHELGHASTREAAASKSPDMARTTGGFLLMAAELQSEHHGFDLTQSFNDRLAALRERFGIPEPADTPTA